MTRALLLSVRLLDGRFHGVGDWPPSPFRLFQALVAGAYGGRWRAEATAPKDAAFRWLESLPPPLLSAPPRVRLRPLTSYVPNNDLDAKGGDPRRANEIRVTKQMRASAFDPAEAFHYAWSFAGDDGHARTLAELATRLHTFGRGIDAAAAQAEIVDAAAAECVLAERGPPSRPGGPGAIPCATAGSLDSLHARHAAFVARLTAPSSPGGPILFRQPPKALYRGVGYDRLSQRLIFDLRDGRDPNRFHPVPQERIVVLTTAVRDCARQHLAAGLPEDRAAEVARIVAGIGAGAADIARRLRILPLPTIGFTYADPAIRRVLVELPPECPIPLKDVAWALSGRTLPGIGATLSEAAPSEMAKHYGVGMPSRRWRSVTPLALTPLPPRGRMSGGERVSAEQTVARNVRNALRQAGFDPREVAIRVQREPWHTKGARAEAFATERFAAARLYHVEVTFPSPQFGPVVLGDGRFLGLGLLRPVDDGAPALHVFELHGARPALSRALYVAQALRRAVMSCVAASDPASRGLLDPFFTGHGEDGTPLRGGRHAHLFFAALDTDGDDRIDHLLVIAPHLADRTATVSKADHLKRLEAGIAGLAELHIPGLGTHRLAAVAADDALTASHVWTSHTRYLPTRHPARAEEDNAVVASDLVSECLRRGLPRPRVVMHEIWRGARGGISATASLHFSIAVRGPVMLGRCSHSGAGVFRPGTLPR